MNKAYEPSEMQRTELDLIQSPLVVEFGAQWCGHCMAAQPLIESAFAPYPNLQHFKVEDGPGRPLGRSFRVKLWPTLIFMVNGLEVSRLVRPASVAEISDALAQIAG